MQIPKRYHNCPRCHKETFISQINDKTFRVSCLCCSDDKWHVDLPIEKMRIELGPGNNGATREGYKTLDINPEYHPDFVGDARDLSRFEDNSIETILAIHILEHLGHWYEIKDILKEWYRVLQLGGYVEIYTPDLEYIINCYLSGEWQEEVKNPNYHFPYGTDKDRDKWINFKLFSTANHFDAHTCCLTYKLLEEYALEAGFSRVERLTGIKESLVVLLYK